jgi:hypothetical protein
MRDLDQLFAALSRSRFRSQFRLRSQEQTYLAEKGRPVVLEHGRQFLLERLAAAVPRNDGRQTPMRGHPIFIAQHATATCCRGCLAKWHSIERGRELTSAEVEYIVRVWDRWLDKQAAAAHGSPEDRGTSREGKDTSTPRQTRSASSSPQKQLRIWEDL